jgi:hypothetical protein
MKVICSTFLYLRNSFQNEFSKNAAHKKLVKLTTVLENPDPEVEPPVIIVSQNVEPVDAVEDPVPESDEPEQVIEEADAQVEQASETVEEEKIESIPENQPQEEVVENQVNYSFIHFSIFSKYCRFYSSNYNC